MVISEKRSCDGNVCLISLFDRQRYDLLIMENRNIWWVFFLPPTTILVCVYSIIGSKSLKWGSKKITSLLKCVWKYIFFSKFERYLDTYNASTSFSSLNSCLITNDKISQWLLLYYKYKWLYSRINGMHVCWILCLNQSQVIILSCMDDF